jgi:hypothetical protein
VVLSLALQSLTRSPFVLSLLPAPFVVLEYHWNDGRMYKGEWRAGMAHGRGVETNRDGSVRHNGHWIDDEPILIDDRINWVTIP